MSRRRFDGTLAELPAAFLARQRAVLGGEADAFERALAGPAVRALRANERKVGLAEVAERLALAVDPVPWCPAATYLPADLLADMRPGDTAEHRAGLFYLQEPSSMAVAEALRIEPGHRVLDVAAAPGGKATHAATRLGADGFLLVNEVVRARLGPLLANLDAWGYPNTAVASSPVPRLALALPGWFDRVIVDAPCSGEALFRRQPASRAQWSEAAVTGAARRQGKLLASAAQMVAAGGLLGYSTCTFGTAENEEQVEAFLARHPGWELADPGAPPGAVTVLGGRALRFYPHRCRCEGQFVAIMRAPADAHDDRLAVRGGARVREGARIRGGAAGRPHPAWTEFAGQALRIRFDPARVRLRGQAFYLLPPSADLPEGLGLRPGLPLGALVGSTFRPAYALAMALRPRDASAAEALTDEELAAFRSGHQVRRPGPPGWVLVTMAGRWPLGWARRSGDVLSPRLPGHARSRGAEGIRSPAASPGARRRA